MLNLPSRDKLLKQVAPHREKWGPRPADVTPEPLGPGDESVWDYPRPPEIRPAGARIRVIFNKRTIAASDDAVKVVETAGAPVYYLPPFDVDMSYLSETKDISVCEWKGAAIYYDLHVGVRASPRAAFAYPDPLDDLGQGFSRIAGWIGFYPGRVDGAFVGDERAAPQEGDIYAGWVTSNIKGPIKGAPGTAGW